MKTMRTRMGIFLSTMALLVAAGATLAAGGGKEYWAKLKQELNLTDAQVVQLQQKFDALHPQGEQAEQRVKSLHQEIENLERAEPRDEKAIEANRAEAETLMRSWREKTNEIYHSVLTKEQFAKFQQMQENKEREQKERREKEKK